jgi:nucleoside-diphosphate-sugar epimerase
VYRTFGILMGTEAGAVSGEPVSEFAPLRQAWYPYRKLTSRAVTDQVHRLADYDKIPAEEVYRELFGSGCNILRLPLVYGPNDPDQRLVPYVRRMMDQRPVILLRESVARWRNARSYVDNVAAAIALVLQYGKPTAVYNVAEPYDHTETEWIRCIAEEAGWCGTIQTVPDDSSLGHSSVAELPDLANYDQHLRMNTDRIRVELGYVEPVARREAMRVAVQDAMRSAVLCTVRPAAALDYRAEDELLATL